MKKNLLKKTVAFAVATALILGSNSIGAFAADDGTAADAPKGDTGTKVSSGAASALMDTTEGDVAFYVTGDDDNTEAGVKTDTATDIGIWAKVVEHGDLVYKVDISWGAMKFEFNNQAGKWDTEQHKYVADGGVEQEWTEDGFIDGTNNLITVVNHSNGAVDASFTYAHDGATDTVFNTEANKTGTSAVRGYFFWTNAQAKTAAKNINDSTAGTVADELDTAFMLGHQDASKLENYGGSVAGETVEGTEVPAVTANTTGSCTRDVYFTFTGKPDPELMEGDITTGFTKVGVITVTIAPTAE